MRQYMKAGLTALAAALLAVSSAHAKVEGDKIILGSAISFTGKYSTNGIHAKNGYDLAVKMINTAGGVTVDGKAYQLEVKYYDDESTPARTGQLLERLINQDGIEFILGPYSSATTKAAAPVTEKYKVPMVEAEGASRSLFNKGYKYLFAVLSTSEQYLASAIDLAAEQAKKDGRDPGSLKVAMAFENDPFSLDVRAGVVEDMKKYGMKIVIDCSNGAGYKVAPRVLADLGADVVPIGCSPNGKNINQDCGSTHPELLQATVKGVGADVGIALDGDGDRLVMVDNEGNLIDGDRIL